MAGPGGRPVGRVSIRALPDTSDFARSLERYLDRVERRLRVELPVSLSKPDVARTEAELAALSRDRTVKVGVDTRGLDKIGKSFERAGAGGRGFGFFSPGLIAAITAAVGVLGAALPGLLAAVASPLAAIVVGFEGIKKAAEQLAEPFKALRTTVAAAFEQGLTPVFANLKAIFPVLEDGAVRIADALTLMADVIVDKLTSPEGLAMLDKIFSNIADALTILAPAMGPFVDSLLILAESGTAAFEKFAPLIAKLIEDFNKFLVWAEESGVLTAAMEAIGFAIYAVIGFFGGLVAASIIAAGALRAFVRGVEVVVGFVRALPGRIAAALAALPGVVVRLFVLAFVNAARAVATGIGNVVRLVGTVRARIARAIGPPETILYRIGLAIMRGLVSGIQAGFGALGGALARVGAFIRANKGPKAKDLKMLEPAGEWIMDGLINGMTSKLPAVKSTLHDVSANITGIGANFGLAAAGGGTVGGATVNQYINAPEGMSTPEIGRHAANRILWAMNLS